MKTLRILAIICFVIVAILIVVGVYMVKNDFISLYDIASSLPYGAMQDFAYQLFGLA